MVGSDVASVAMSRMDKTFSFVSPLRYWLDLDAEERALTLAEDPSFADYVRQALNALNVECQVADEARMVREVARRGLGYGWARFDELVRWSAERHHDREKAAEFSRVGPAEPRSGRDTDDPYAG